jgi:3-phosphoshikimate 1-carboxyvinyltransferase
VTAPNAVDVTVPGDKSMTHRALIFSALAEGRSHLTGLLDAADTRSTAAVLRGLGVDIPAGPLDSLVLEGKGLHGFSAPVAELDCGNSGTTARLLLGALAGCPMEAVLTGDASLRRRPMRRVTRPLAEHGAVYEEVGEPGRLPIRVRGQRPLRPMDVHNVRSSAQVKTAILLAGLTGGARVRITESARSRDHSERLLQAMGAPVRTEHTNGSVVVTMARTERLAPLEMAIPGDFSSAAYFLVLGALWAPVRARRVGLNPTRTGLLDVLGRMGAVVEVEGRDKVAGEPVGSVVVSPGALKATVIRGHEVPSLLDEIPVLAALAARARGETRFEEIGELRVKESDRIQAMADNLAALGVETDAGPDHLVVRGTDRPLRGEARAFGDHRIAMACGVLAALPENEIAVQGRDTVAISYPSFWTDLDRVTTALESE